MRPDEIGLLWEARFRKIYEMENESLEFYRGLLKNDELVSESPRLQTILEDILEDEERHAVICQELIKLTLRRRARQQARWDSV